MVFSASGHQLLGHVVTAACFWCFGTQHEIDCSEVTSLIFVVPLLQCAFLWTIPRYSAGFPIALWEIYFASVAKTCNCSYSVSEKHGFLLRGNIFSLSHRPQTFDPDFQYHPLVFKAPCLGQL